MTRLALLLPLLAAGCMSDALPEPPAPADAAGTRYLALGDSYTIGEGVAPADRWPVVLVERLRADGVALGGPQIVARTGWTTDELDAALDAADLEPPYALVTLLIGVNNQYRGRPLDEYRAQVAGLLDRAIGFAGSDPDRVVVVSFPDWGVTPFAAGRDRAQIAYEVDAFNAAAAEIAGARGVRFVDVTPLSRAQGGLTTSDGLHPNAEAYRAWVDLIEPAAREALVP